MITLRERGVENSHQRVTLKRCQGSLFLPDSFAHNIEITIDEIHHFFRDHTFAQAGIAANIGENNRDFFGLATEIERGWVFNQAFNDGRMDVTLENAANTPGLRL